MIRINETGGKRNVPLFNVQEENYYLYVNYDGFVQATTGGHRYLASQEGRIYQTLSRNVTEIGRNTEKEIQAF